MTDIGIRFNKKDFEYDIYSLVKAFYPHDNIHTWYEGEEPEQKCKMTLLITYCDQEICLVIEENSNRIYEDKAAVVYKKDRKETKNILKRLVYQGMVSITGRKLPWGNLTGIRPTKIPMGLIEKGWKNPDIARYMRETYAVSPEKTALAIATANREKAILEKFDYKKGYSLYVGIPFCPSICLYCSFGSHPLEKWIKRVDEYLDSLCKELTYINQLMKDVPLQSVYIGGGTPTTLEPDQMRRLLTHIQNTFDFSQVQEYTVEAGRPDSITEDKLKVLREFPVGRISVNPQTMNQKTLDIIGRKHTVEDVKEIFHMARNMGFDNINMDIIIGLPGEGKDEVAHTLEEIEKLAPDSLTVHSLALKRGTRLNLFRGEYEEMSFENSREIMDMTSDCAHRMGMGPYYLYRQKNIAGNFENVGYAEVDKAGIYNILMMEEKHTVMAAGAGASTKLVFENGERIERVENVKDVTNYISRIDEMLERKRVGVETYLR